MTANKTDREQGLRPATERGLNPNPIGRRQKALWRTRKTPKSEIPSVKKCVNGQILPALGNLFSAVIG
jgi:hypothetical protein